MFCAPLVAHAVVLVVSVRDPTTIGSYPSLSAAQREAAFPEIGDIIGVCDDDWALDDARFGRKECRNLPPANGGTLVCIELLGLTRQEALPLASHIMETGRDGTREIKRFRRFKLDWDKLPEGLRNELYYTGKAAIDIPDWQGRILDKGGIKP